MRILITAGPTREYIDDVRYLSNASSGRMGYTLAAAAVAAGHTVALVSGPVALKPPVGCDVHPVETTDQLQETCLRLFPKCDGVIASAAVCDYRPLERISGKLTKTGRPITFKLVETADVLAELGACRDCQWIVGFALESQDPRTNALRKLKMKNCDWIVVNDTSAIGSETNSIEILDAGGQVVLTLSGPKTSVAVDLITWLEQQFAGQACRRKGE